MTDPNRITNCYTLRYLVASRQIQRRLINEGKAPLSWLAHLRWRDLDFTRAEMLLSHPKTGRTRIAPITARLKVPLLLWQEEQIEFAATRPGVSKALADPGTAYVFLDRHGKPFSAVEHATLFTWPWRGTPREHPTRTSPSGTRATYRPTRRRSPSGRLRGGNGDAE